MTPLTTGPATWRVSSRVSDHHSDRPAEDSPAAAAGARGQEDRPLLRVRRRLPPPAHGHVRSGRPLARLHLVSGLWGHRGRVLGFQIGTDTSRYRYSIDKYLFGMVTGPWFTSLWLCFGGQVFKLREAM